MKYTRPVSILLFIWFMPLLAMSQRDGDGWPTDVTDYAPNELVCQLKYPGTADSLNQLYGTSIKDFLYEIGTYLLATQPGLDTDSLAAIISQSPFVSACQPNLFVDAPEAVQSSQPFIDLQAKGSFTGQDAARSTNLPSAHTLSTGTGIRVGIIDGGLDFSHPLFTGTSGYIGRDFIDNDLLPFDEPGGRSSGHGTFVAGVIKLVAPEANILTYRILNPDGRGDAFTVAKAILQAVEDSCRVINLSLVMMSDHAAINRAIDYARQNNVLIVAAAGNDSSGIARFPASDFRVLSVAALDSSQLKADFSNYGSHIDICAPGSQIYSPYLDTTYAWWNGSSFAAPFVSGQAALIMAQDPNRSWVFARRAILETAVDIDILNPGFTGNLGAGLIDPVASLNFIPAYICGDINVDGQGPDVSDLTALIDHLFISLSSLANLSAANIDGSGGGDIDISDITLLISRLFIGGTEPVCGP